jgi:hypothetical protein
MKNRMLICVVCFVLLSFTAASQGNSKGKNKSKSTTSAPAATPRHEDIIWEGTKDFDGGRPKPSKNQPAKVRAAFARDYPNITNVRWSKYRGDWTATFTNGPFISTAVYHANGDRRDTRTSLMRSQLPPVILESISKKLPGAEIGVGVKIEMPQVMKDIFRIKAIANASTHYLYYNSDGAEVKYNY